MNSINLSNGIGTLICVTLLVFSTGAYSNRQEASKRICVVAVHDSSLFTLCPLKLRQALADGLLKKLPLPGDPWYTNLWNHMFNFGRYGMYVTWDGRLSTVSAGASVSNSDLLGMPAPLFLEDRSTLEQGRPDWQELSKLVPGVSPSGWIDPTTADEIKAELRKSKSYVLVDSADNADVVFLAEGIYTCYWPAGGTPINYTLMDDGIGWMKNLCLAIMAIEVPADVYRRSPADAQALLDACSWEGISLHRVLFPANGPSHLPGGTIGGTMVYDGSSLAHSASAKDLVGRFLKKEKWPANVPPISPAWKMMPLAASEESKDRPDSTTALTQSNKEQRPVVLPGGNTVFTTSTILVEVPVIARDADGRCVSGLGVGDFHVYENGVQQEIDRFVSESAPFHAALMVDISHSTGPARPDIENAALTFINDLRPDDELMVLSFTNKIFVDSEFTSNKYKLRPAVTELNKHGGGSYYYGDDLSKRMSDRTAEMGTRLYDALDLAITQRFDKLSGRKAILLFTDGVDSGSRLASQQSTCARIEESDVLLYVIQYDTPVQKTINRDAMTGMTTAHAQGAQYLQQLATNSGGRLFKASTNGGYQAAFSSIEEEMGHQYTLYYYPKHPINSTAFRRIQVTVDRPGVKISSRAGYRPIPSAK